MILNPSLAKFGTRPVSRWRLLARALFSLLAVAPAIGLAAATSDIRLPVVSAGAMRKLGGYLPLRLALLTKKPAGLKQVPAGLTAPLYGTLKLGPGNAPTSIIVVVDEPDGSPSRLFVDANANGDLTDDPAPKWSPRPVKGKDGAEYQQYSGVVKVTIPLGGETTELSLPVYRFDKRDPARATLKGFLFYYSDYGREGEVTLGEKTYHVLLADLLATGDFRGKSGAKPSGVSLLIDVNGNGKFEKEGERFDVRQPFNIAGTTYEIAGLTAGGESFRIVKSSKTVAEQKVVASRPGLAAGQPAIKFKARSTGGAAIDFPAGYPGKVVLLDFWAIWCGPCIGELPHLTAAYQKYHDQGFEVLGISLDREGDGRKLADFTKKNRMPWPQIFDGKYWQAEIAQLYGVRSIPTAYLVDGDTGLVIASTGLRGAELEKTVAAALARKRGQ